MKAKKSKGPNTVPCGTPEITSAWEDLHSSNSTRCFLWPRKDSIHCSVCLLYEPVMIQLEASHLYGTRKVGVLKLSLGVLLNPR